MSIPPNWSKEVQYLKGKYLWDPSLTKEQRNELIIPSHLDPVNAPLIFKDVERTKLTGSDLTPAKLKIKIIDDSSHPAHCQRGLFSLQKLSSEQFILDYIGFVSLNPSSTSDYVLNFIHSLSIDAERFGNEGRYINDYRGVSMEPNAVFQVYFHPQTRHLRMGVFVKKGKMIRKNEEILVTYGKAFWRSRMPEVVMG